MCAGWRLRPVELDLVWERLGLGEHPYPLAVPSFGATLEERAAAVRRAPEPERALAEALRLLARPSVWVDAVWLAPVGAGEPHRALAARAGGHAVLAVQEPGGDFRVAEVRPTALVNAVLALLPPAEPARASVTVPARTAAGPPGVLRHAGHWQDPESLARHRLAEILRQHKRAAGQFAANGRDRLGRVRRSATLSWFDAPRRHLLVRGPGTDGADWVTVAGADHARLHARLSELLDSVAAG